MTAGATGRQGGATGYTGARGWTGAQGHTGAQGVIPPPDPPPGDLVVVLVVVLVSAFWIAMGFGGLWNDDDTPQPARTGTATSVPVKTDAGDFSCTVSYGTTIVFSACTPAVP